MLLCLLLLSSSLSARERQLIVLIPVPQGKFPPPWTQTIHVAAPEVDDSTPDHRFYKKGKSEFRAVLKGLPLNQSCAIEVMCLSKGEKTISVFRQNVKVKANDQKLVLDKLKFVETLKVP